MSEESADLLLDERFSADPYTVYAELRQVGPVCRARLPNGVPAWVVTRYAECRAALADSRLSKDLRVVERILNPSATGDPRRSLNANMLHADPPEHTRLRRLVSTAFTARRVASLRPRIEELTDELITSIESHGAADLIADFALPLPTTVICSLLGLPPQDRSDFSPWLNTLLCNAVEQETTQAVDAIREYLTRRIADHRERPSESLLSALVQARDVGEDRLSDQELVATAFLLLVAGHETTVNLIGNGMLSLLRHPEQMTMLRRDPSLAPGAVEEFLRYDGPVNTATFRCTLAPTEIGGQLIPAGQIVLVALASADRDPDKFEDADHFDISRDTRGHLAFGHGIHYCLGAPLARLEGEVAFPALLRRLPGLRLAIPPERLSWRPSLLMRGLAALPVRFDPGPPRVTALAGEPADRRSSGVSADGVAAR